MEAVEDGSQASADLSASRPHKLTVAVGYSFLCVLSMLPGWLIVPEGKWGHFLPHWSYIPTMYIFSLPPLAHESSSWKLGLQGLLGALIASLNMSLLNDLLPPTRGGACIPNKEGIPPYSNPPCEPLWWPGYDTDFTWSGFFPFLIIFCDFSCLGLLILRLKSLHRNVKIFALMYHVNFIMYMLKGTARTELTKEKYIFRFNVIVTLDCVLGALLAMLAVMLQQAYSSFFFGARQRLAQSQAVELHAPTRLAPPSIEGSQASARLVPRSLRSMHGAVLVPHQLTENQLQTLERLTSLEMCLWKWAAIFTCFVIGWAGLVEPIVDIRSPTLASTACLFMDEIESSSPDELSKNDIRERGQRRFLGIALGSILGFLALTLCKSYPLLLFLAALALQAWALYWFLTYLSDSTHAILKVDWQICAVYLAITMLPANGFSAWIAQMRTSEGMAWALADQYRLLFANLLAVLITTVFDYLRLSASGCRLRQRD